MFLVFTQVAWARLLICEVTCPLVSASLLISSLQRAFTMNEKQWPVNRSVIISDEIRESQKPNTDRQNLTEAEISHTDNL